jgi:putative ABC transport system permease protein
MLFGELRYAIRRLRRSPGFTAFAVVSLALGIGATTAIYSVIYFLLWRPVGVVEPERIVDVRGESYVPGQPAGSRLLSALDFEDLVRQQTSFSTLAASISVLLPVTDARVAAIASGEAVSDDYFSTFGVQAATGRLLGAADNASGALRVAVVSEPFSRARFGSERAAVGQVVKVAGHSVEIVGVVPRSFPGTRSQSFLFPTAFWIPLAAAPDVMAVTLAPVDVMDRTRRRLTVQGRLAPGRTVVEATGEVALIGRRVEAAFPTPGTAASDSTAGRRWSAERPRTMGDGREHVIGTAIVAAVALVLLIACTNLANLSLARGSARHAEQSVRRALGASRWRLVREQLIESIIITVAGSALSIAVIRIILVASTAEIPISRAVMFQLSPEVSWPAAALAAGAVVLSLLIFGLWPALQVTRTTLRPGLSEESATAPPRWRAHRTLVAWQVTGSVTLLLIAAACVKGLAMFPADPGVDVDRIALAEIDFRTNGRTDAQARPAIDAIVALLQQQPGVEAAAASFGLPFGTVAPQRTVTTPDKPLVKGQDIGENAYVVCGTAGIFRTLGVEILRGQPFSEEQVRQQARVIVLTDMIARSVFGSSDAAIGRRVLLGGVSYRTQEILADEFTVVGVSSDVDTFNMGRRLSGAVFLPFGGWFDVKSVPFNPSVIFTARTAGDSSRLVAVLRNSIRSVDSDLAIGLIGTGSTLLTGPLFFVRVFAWLTTGLGLLALVLAMAGLYGVLSHVVARRTRELGVRMALGATSGRLIRMVLADGWRPVRLGLVVGLIVGAIGRLGLRAVLPVRLSPVDPVAFAVVPVLMAVAAFVACYLPARRAARVDPNAALKNL